MARTRRRQKRPAPTPPVVPAPPAPARAAVRGTPYDLGPRITRDEWTMVHDPLAADQDPLMTTAAAPRPRVTHRTLRIYTQDPSTPLARVPVTRLEVPYEPLAPGPIGAYLVVDDRNDTTREVYVPVNLDDAAVLLGSGLKPSTATPGFAQQMTYALAVTTYERFRKALGRDPQFAFPAHPGDSWDDRPAVKLHIRPHAREEDNACYDPDAGALEFGYTYAGDKAQGLDQPGGLVFTALSHDVVVHEMTHALLDGLRSQLMLPTSRDVDGFHEGFADLVALLQRFSYRDVVRSGLADAKGALTSRILVDLAVQFGAATGDGRTPLRSALDPLEGVELNDEVPPHLRYQPTLEAHDMGAVLLRAVFDAFRAVFATKTAPLRRLAGHIDPMPEPLLDLLTGEASKLAEQFTAICIRAVDYCPPVDLRLGEYLRAIITADYDLVPDDPSGYREALVRAFRRHGITVDGVADLSEDSLRWQGPDRRLAFNRRPAPFGATPQQAQRQCAEELGAYITRPENLQLFGLAPSSPAKGIDRPVIESVRRLRRIGPDGTLNDDFVAEVLQRRKVNRRWMHGGSTVIFNRDGVIRYVIVKSVSSERRQARIGAFLDQHREAETMFTDGARSPAMRLRRLHRRRGRPARGGGAG